MSRITLRKLMRAYRTTYTMYTRCCTRHESVGDVCGMHHRWLTFLSQQSYPANLGLNKGLCSDLCVGKPSSATATSFHSGPLGQSPAVNDFVQTEENSIGKSEVEKDVDLQNQSASSSRKIGVTRDEQRKLLRKKPDQPPDPHLLKVAIIGSPNAGKSTLANQLLAWRYAAVSSKVHTTRNNAIGVLTEGNSQIIFLDTPGITNSEKVKRHNLEKTLLTDPYSSLFEADMILAVVDISKVWNRSRLDTDVLTALALHSDKRSALVLNKVDLVRVKSDLLTSSRILTEGRVGGEVIHPKKKAPEYEEILERMDGKHHARGSIMSRVLESQSDIEKAEEPSGEPQQVTEREINMDDSSWWRDYKKQLKHTRQQMAKVRGWNKFDRIFMVSAIDGDGVDDIRDYLVDLSEPAPWQYDSSLVTDQDPRQLAEMCVWEKLLDHLPDEIPYQIKVKTTTWELDENEVLRACFDLVCDKKRHTIHLLGNRAETLRTISREAKQDLMNTFRTEMTLQLAVRTVPKSKPR